MEFKFSRPDKDIIMTLAFAIDKDDNIQIAAGDNPIDTYAMTEILGKAIKDVYKNDGTDNDFVDKRDQVHKIIRIFTGALNADLLAANWRKPEDELPTLSERDVFFVLKGQNRYDVPHEGYYDNLDSIFRDDDGTGYQMSDVAYWMPYPKIPMQKEKEPMKTAINICPHCGEVSTVDEKHIWGGEEKPAHVKNIKDWTLQVDDKLLYSTQKLVEEMYRRTYDYGGALSEDQEEVINTVARETLDKLYDTAREHGIEVWHPTADNDEF